MLLRIHYQNRSKYTKWNAGECYQANGGEMSRLSESHSQAEESGVHANAF